MPRPPHDSGPPPQHHEHTSSPQSTRDHTSNDPAAKLSSSLSFVPATSARPPFPLVLTSERTTASDDFRHCSANPGVPALQGLRRAGPRLDWTTDFDQVLDWSDALFAKWLVGGTLTVVYNTSTLVDPSVFETIAQAIP
jgi:hypothetical protein